MVPAKSSESPVKSGPPSGARTRHDPVCARDLESDAVSFGGCHTTRPEVADVDKHRKERMFRGEFGLTGDVRAGRCAEGAGEKGATGRRVIVPPDAISGSRLAPTGGSLCPGGGDFVCSRTARSWRYEVHG